ncbi:MAG: type II secretion system minor pseudopilin GspI [Pseudomonadota bacterium]
MTRKLPVRRADQGFTLIEVLVSLAIFGVVALTLLTTSRDQTRQAAAIEDRLLAHWIALNTLTDLQAGSEYLEVGVTDTTAVMAGRDWFVTIVVSTTPSPAVRHLDISVAPYDPISTKAGNDLVTEVGFLRQRGAGQ